MKIYTNADGNRIAVVNNLIKSQPEVKLFLHVFRFEKGYPKRVTEKYWPHKIGSTKFAGNKVTHNY